MRLFRIIYCTGSCRTARKQTCLMGYSPLLSFVVLMASVALAPSPSLPDFSDSGGAHSWWCGRVWSSERLLTERRKRESHPPSTFYSIQKARASSSSPLGFAVVMVVVLMEGVEVAGRSDAAALFRFAWGVCSSFRPWSWCSRWFRILMTASFSKIWA